MTANYANTIWNIETNCQEIHRQGKDFCNSLNLGKVVVIYKANKLVLSKMHMSLKTKSSENLTQKVFVLDLCL